MKKNNRNSELLASVFRASLSQMALTNLTTHKYVEVNDAFLQSLGFTREEVIGRSALELNLFADPAQRDELLQRMAAQGYLRHEHVLVRAKSGEIRHGIFYAEYVQADGQKLLLTVMNDITEKLRAEERWQYALEGAGDGVWDWNPQTDKVFFSPGWKSMLGYEEDEIGDSLGEWTSRIHPDDLAVTMKKVDAHLEGKTPVYRSEHRVRCKDGTYKWILDGGKVIEWTADGKPLRVIGTHKDISERMTVEEKLHESEERFSRVFHANPAAQIIVSAVDGSILDVNDAYCQQTGFARTEIVGHMPREFEMWSDPSQQMKMVQQLRAGTRVSNVEIEFRIKSGERRTMLVSFEPVQLKGVQCIISSAVDITERKQAEQALRESEERFRSFIEQSVDGFMLTDENGSIIEWNHALAQITGLPREQALGMPMWDMQYALVVSKARPSLAQAQGILREILQNGQSPHLGRAANIEIQTAGGKRKFVQQTSFPVRTAHGYRIGAVIRDVTKQKRMEQELEAEAVRRRILFEEAPDGILVVDPKTAGFIEFNTTAHTQLGYPREEFAKLHIFDVEAQETMDETRKHIEKVLVNGRSDFETKQRTKQGEIRNIHVTARTVEILGQQVYYCTWRDITERKRAEEELELFFNMIPDMACIASADGYFKKLNGEWKRTLGFSQEELLSRPLADFIHPEDRESTFKEIARQVGGDATIRFVNRYQTKNGFYRWLEWNATPSPDGVLLFAAARDITEHKQAEESVRNSEARFSALFQSNPSAIAVTRLSDNTLLDVNRTWERITGWSREEVLGKNPVELGVWVVPSERERLKQNLLEHGAVHGFEIQMRSRSGTVRDLLMSAETITLLDEPCMLTMTQDITERKHAEEKLRESESRYQQFISLTLEAISRTEFDHPIDTSLPVEEQIDLIYENAYMAECNQAMASMYHTTVEAFINMRLIDAHHGKDNPVNRDAFRRFIRGGYRSTNTETTEHAVDGTPIWLLNNTVGVVEDGKLVRLWETSLDITETKRAQENLRLAEQRYRALIENAPDGIVLIDANGKFQYASPSVERIFGYGQEDIPHYDAAGLTYPEDLPMVVGELAKLLRDPSYIPTIQYRFKHKNGDWRWIESTFSNLLSVPNVEGVIVNFRDIHERKQAEDALNKSQALLNEAQRIGRIGHMEWNGMDQNLICSDEIYEIFDVPHGTAMSQKAIVNMMKPGESGRIHKLDMEAFQHRTDTDYEYCIITKDGSERWLHHRGKMTYSDNGEPIRMMSIVQDVTKRRQVDEKLRESEERYRSTLDNMMEGCQIIDFDWQYIYLNDAAVRHGRKGREELLGRTMMETYPGIEATEMFASLRACMDTRKTQQMENEFIYPDGSHGWFELSIAPIPEGIFILSMDITERKQSEQRLREQMDDMALVNALNEASNRGESLERIIETFSQEIRRVFKGKNASIYLLTPDGQSLVLQHHSLPEPLLKGIEKIIGGAIPKIHIAITPESHFTEILSREKGVIISDAETLEKWIAEYADTSFLPDIARPTVKALAPKILKYVGIQSVIAIPLKSGEKTLGVIEVSSAKMLSERELERLQNARASLTEIIKRKQVEQELRASEEKYRGLMESLDNAVSTVDANGRFLYMNDKGAERLGGSPQELIGRTMKELFPEPSASQQMAAIRTVFETDRESVFEAQSMDRNGAHWYRFSLEPLHDEAGNVSQVLVNATDIHDLKTAQQNLMELNRTLEERVKQRAAEVQDLYDNAPTGYHSLDREGRFTSINQTELGWLGYPREEILGHSFQDFITEDSAQTFQDVFPVFKKDGKISNLEFEIRRKDGSTFPIMINATAVLDENGQFLSSRSTMTDITIRKQAEDELKRNINFTSALLNAIPTPVFYKDKSGKYLGCNHAFSELMGKTANEIRGKSVFDLWPNENAVLFNNKDRELLKTQERQVYEGEIPDKHGNHLSVIFIKDVYFDESAEVAGVVGAFIDITTRKQAEETLRLANAEMERALRLKDEFLANMSHELRTPLNAILGISESLLEQMVGPLNEKQVKYLTTVAESGQHLLELINDVLDLAKINAGRVTLDISKVDVGAVAQSSLRMIYELAQKKGLETTVKIDEAVTTVLADERRLKQMLVNLLINAVKFTPQGGRIGLEINGNPEAKTLHFTIWDTGIGIAQKDLRLLFQPFVQLDAGLTRGSQGTGLGLVLVSQMARLHGGSISVQSEPNKGSRFTISIPWTIGSQADPLVHNPAVQKPQHPSEARHATILLVEDTEAVTMLISDYLQKHGYRVVTAGDGLEGLDIAKKTRPDLILMDVMMPKMDGLETTRRIRSEPELAGVPIIGLTALAMTGDRERCLKAGMNDYLSKPIRLQELIQAIHTHILPGQKGGR
ncbi:MAG: PAS domain S-box protein [Chloroflexota bacterium]